MTFAELKTQVRSMMADSEVRGFGDLRFKDTWEAAYDKCSEAIAIAVDELKPVMAKVVEVVTSDKAKDFYRGVLMVVALMVAVIVIGLSRAVRQGWSEVVRPMATIVYAYGRDKVAMGWRKLGLWVDREFDNAVSLVVFAWQGFD